MVIVLSPPCLLASAAAAISKHVPAPVHTNECSILAAAGSRQGVTCLQHLSHYVVGSLK